MRPARPPRQDAKVRGVGYGRVEANATADTLTARHLPVRRSNGWANPAAVEQLPVGVRRYLVTARMASASSSCPTTASNEDAIVPARSTMKIQGSLGMP